MCVCDTRVHLKAFDHASERAFGVAADVHIAPEPLIYPSTKLKARERTLNTL